VLASHAANRRLPVASTTKLMTAYVAMQELPLRRIVRAAPYDAIYGESLLELDPGERVSVRDLLYGLILRSGNDAAYDLALAAAGSERAFVRQMNRRAAALGLANSHFANPIGLDEKGNYSSAYDLTALARLMVFESFLESLLD
jgi:D-alanyl-D-alanine carboxypeptidase